MSGWAMPHVDNVGSVDQGRAMSRCDDANMVYVWAGSDTVIMSDRWLKSGQCRVAMMPGWFVSRLAVIR